MLDDQLPSKRPLHYLGKAYLLERCYQLLRSYALKSHWKCGVQAGNNPLPLLEEFPDGLYAGFGKLSLSGAMFHTAAAIDALGIDYLSFRLLHLDSLHRTGSQAGVAALASLIY